jgi:hypothetical protein
MPLPQPNTVPIGMGPVGIGTLGSTPGRFLMTRAGAIIPHSLGMVSPMDTADTDTAVASEDVVSVLVDLAVAAFTAAAAAVAVVAVADTCSASVVARPAKNAQRDFYSRDFIPSMPPDTTLTPVSRTVGEDQLVDEMIGRSYARQLLSGWAADLAARHHFRRVDPDMDL